MLIAAGDLHPLAITTDEGGGRNAARMLGAQSFGHLAEGEPARGGAVLDVLLLGEAVLVGRGVGAHTCLANAMMPLASIWTAMAASSMPAMRVNKMVPESRSTRRIAPANRRNSQTDSIAPTSASATVR